MHDNRLKNLQEEHHALDKRISGLESTGRFDDAQMQELKKQKLNLKDQIEQIKRKHQDG